MYGIEVFVLCNFPPLSMAIVQYRLLSKDKLARLDHIL